MTRFDELQKGLELPGDCGNTTTKAPPWLDREKFYRARRVFQSHFFSIFFAHLTGLMFVVSIPGMLAPLLYTGNSSNLVRIFRRYVSTMRHVRQWYEGDIWNTEDPAYKSIVLIRQMHNKVANKINLENVDTTQSNCAMKQSESLSSSQQSTKIYLSQYHMVLTQFSFIGLIIMFPRLLGIYCSREDIECFIHFWRGVGYQLGIDDRFNICSGSVEETEAFCMELTEKVMKPSITSSLPESERMSKDIIRAMSVLIPCLNWTAIMRFWFDIFGVTLQVKCSFYASVCYWFMIVTYRFLLRITLFRIFFNFLIRMSYWRAINWSDSFEKHLTEKMT
ncbi:uncharacterized protein LOC143226531 isoform X1 [Tachypleus tridentatus]|uniref:uncharacterized protein LOC143226531 isoform X1 n=2 Tax=Tachypleus tridentatus TaxID=6853 RepID=UPI003FD42D25